MNNMFDPLQQREVFHLAFLRALGRALPLASHALKGGSNLRFFFGSIRYSEDMDLDVSGVPVHVLRDKVMAILGSGGLADTLRTYGVDRVVPPDLGKAKQTETVQRFKVHLITSAGEDLSTKVEFSRRGLDAPVRSEAVSASILARYHMAPLIASHYAAEAAVLQKLRALIGRSRPEPRDVFDLHVLSTRLETGAEAVAGRSSRADAEKARERLFSLDWAEYRDAVVGFLDPEDQESYGSAAAWDQIRLAALAVIERAASR